MKIREVFLHKKYFCKNVLCVKLQNPSFATQLLEYWSKNNVAAYLKG